VEFRILGPIEAIGDNGENLSLGGSRSRALLAALLVDAGMTIDRATLIDGLWASPPPTASHALEVFVSRLRGTIGRDRIRCHGHAYRFEVDAAELDLARFRMHARAGREALAACRYEAASCALADALAAWRGDAVACLNGEPLARDVRAFLEEERLSAVEAAVDADLALGRHDELVPALRRLVASHPTRERFCGRLMLALYRGGRQIDALDVFARLRLRLCDELGLEPGPETRALHRSILEHDPRLEICPQPA